MELLNLVDIHFLFSLGIILTIFCLFYSMAARKQKQAIVKMDVSLKSQEQTNQLLNSLLAELRRSNRYLADLASMDAASEYPQPAHYQQQQGQYASHAPAHASSQPARSMNYPAAATLAPTSSSTQGADAAANSQFKLYVGNIDYSATETELADHFAQFGHVEFVNIPVNRYTGRARGFGFVTFASQDEAERAMKLDGTEFKGRQIQVNFAKERERDTA